MNDFPPVLAMAFLPVNAWLSVETIKAREVRVIAACDTCGVDSQKATFRTLAAGGYISRGGRHESIVGGSLPPGRSRRAGRIAIRRLMTHKPIAGDVPAASTILPSAQCSTGTSQSRRHPARPGKVMESAGHQRHGAVALPGEIGRIKVPTAAPAAGSV